MHAAIETIEAPEKPFPFNLKSDFGIALYDVENDRFVPTFYHWTDSGHIALSVDAPAFVTEREARTWLRTQKPQIEIHFDPNAPDAKYEAHFCVHVSNLAKVKGKCENLGLPLATGPVSYKQVLDAWGIYFTPLSTRKYRENTIARAEVAAQSYVNVHIRAPKAEKEVIAVARMECGMPVFHTLAEHDDSYWTAERINSVDFKRCDQCNTRHNRVKLFLVRNTAGEIEQYGGSCAKHLNLAKLVDNHLRGLKALQAFLDKSCGEEWGWSGGSSKNSQRVDPRLALVVADMMIAEHGYVSGSSAYHSHGDLVSTKSHVLEALSLLLNWAPITHWSQKEEKARLEEKLKEYPEARAQAMYERAEAIVAEKLEAEVTEFTSNLNVAFRTGSLKLLGFLVWLPSLLRKIDATEARRKIEAAQAPWTPSELERPTTGTELNVFIATHYHGDELYFCEQLGVKEAAVKRALAKPEKTLTKALIKKLERTVPGTWTITNIRSWMGDFGTTFFLTLARKDGAKIQWKTGNPETVDGDDVNEGDEIIFRGASIGDIPKAFVSQKNGKTYQDGRIINRVSCYQAHKTLPF